MIGRRCVFVVLVPRATTVRPDGLSEDRGRMRHEIGHGFGFGSEGVDVFGLVSIDELEHIVCLAFDCREKWAAGERVVRTVKDKVIREVGYGDCEICCGACGPFVLEAFTMLADQGEARDVTRVEASSADEDVERVFRSVTTDTSIRRNLGDLTVDYFDVFRRQGFQVIDTRRGPSTAYSRGRNKKLL